MSENITISTTEVSNKFPLFDELGLNVKNKSYTAIVNKLNNLFRGNCKRILLIQPLPFNTEYFEINQANNKRYYNWPPYGLAVLCKNIKERGYETKILDINFEVLSYVNNSLKDFDDVSVQKKVGKIWKEKTRTAIDDFNPDLVALTCMFTMGHEMLIRTSDFIRENYPSIPIMAGGVHITNAPEYTLSVAKNIDFAGLYEGDTSLCDMIDIINGKIEINRLKQVSTIIDGEYHAISSRSTPSPTELNVVPDFDGLPLELYSGLGEVGSYRSWLPPNSRSASVLSNSAT